nr:MAG TPA: hypothetical protein [Bacteriophage sp.]
MVRLIIDIMLINVVSGVLVLSILIDLNKLI